MCRFVPLWLDVLCCRLLYRCGGVFEVFARAFGFRGLRVIDFDVYVYGVFNVGFCCFVVL